MTRLQKTGSFLGIGLTLVMVGSVPAQVPTLNGQRPLVLGHRGASGYRPEHTLASYDLAISQGANFIEPDLVSTSDGILIARHEPMLAVINPTTLALIEETTDVRARPEFANRLQTRVLDGVTVTGWWAQDFTLAEIKTLRARERIPGIRPQNATFNGQFEIPTLQEVIDLARTRSMQTGRTIGIYPETKHPTYHDGIGLSLEEPLVNTLKANDLDDADDAVFIQSFEVANLREINARTDIAVPIVQLFGGSGRPFDFTVAGDLRTYSDLAMPAGLTEIATYANGIGPDKGRVIPVVGGNLSDTPTSLVADAHARGLLVHPYTFRIENTFLPNQFDIGMNPNDPGNLVGELRAFLNAGVDGFFTDNPDQGVAAVPEPTGFLCVAVGIMVAARRRLR